MDFERWARFHQVESGIENYFKKRIIGSLKIINK